ncbi:MAG: M48 family metallopeptidase [Candidatus Moranbacteria bacterium]|nr:M48 family metallopeptidase [Candidatus Moranbacteria bacterium]
MQKEIQLRNENISYELRESSRARCLRITIHPGGELSAVLPRGMAFEKLEKFIQQKADWILRKINLAKKRKSAFLLPKSSRKDYLKYKIQALGLAKQKIEELNAFYNFQCARISIRNQKTRWGSCNRKGNLNFNYRIIHLPEKYLDYIIVHELCHLKELNHAKNFWELVGQAIPDYKEIRKDIRSI